MCMEDIRIGRKLEAAPPRTVACVVGLNSLCDQDPNRTRLIISADAAGIVYVGPVMGGAGIARMWTLNIEAPAKVFTVEEFGKLVTWRWAAVCAVIGDIYVTEMGTRDQ